LGLRIATTVSAALAVLAIGACRRAEPPANASNLDLIRSAAGGAVAQVCASAETAESLKAVLLHRIDTAASPSKAAAKVRAALDEGLVVSLDEPVPTDFDQDRRKLGCSARIVISWPQDLARKLKRLDPTGDWTAMTGQADYTVRPNVSQTALVYTLAGPGLDDGVETARRMGRILTRGARPAASGLPSAASVAAREAADQDYVEAAGDTRAARASDSGAPE
jgi:hypothetical protein